MLKEFKEFAVKGNMVDLAVGLIIGGAFGSIVSSLVKDVIMPPISALMGKTDFSNLFVLLKAGEKLPPPYDTLKAAQDAGAITLNYGQFANLVINFLIVAWAVFMLVKLMNKLRRQPEPEPEVVPETPRQEVLLEEIRDLLKAKA